MDIVLELDYDTIGIIYDFLSDNYDFFLYIKNNNLCPNKTLNVSRIDWDEVSNRSDLTYDIIIEYENMLNWSILTENNMWDIEFIRRFKERIKWRKISTRMTLFDFEDYKIFEEFHDKLDWEMISGWSHINDDFIDEFHHHLDWEILSIYQGLTEYIIEKYPLKIRWNLIKYNNHLAPNILRKYVKD